MRQVSVFTGFRRLTGCQRDPRDRGVTEKIYIVMISFPPLNNLIAFSRGKLLVEDNGENIFQIE